LRIPANRLQINLLLLRGHFPNPSPADEQPSIFSCAASVSSSIVIAETGEVDEIDLDDEGKGIKGGDVIIAVGEGRDKGDVFVGLDNAVSVGVGGG